MTNLVIGMMPIVAMTVVVGRVMSETYNRQWRQIANQCLNSFDAKTVAVN